MARIYQWILTGRATTTQKKPRRQFSGASLLKLFAVRGGMHSLHVHCMYCGRCRVVLVAPMAMMPVMLVTMDALACTYGVLYSMLAVHGVPAMLAPPDLAMGHGAEMAHDRSGADSRRGLGMARARRWCG